MNGSNNAFCVGGLLAILWLSLAGTMLGQEKPAAETKPQTKCNAYRVDTNTNRIHFNAAEPWIAIPNAADRNRLRVQGELGQVFAMQNCDAPDLIAKIPVYKNPEEMTGSTLAEIASGQPVLILEQRGDWHRVKGRPINVGAPVIWSGEGWVKADQKTILVKY